MSIVGRGLGIRGAGQLTALAISFGLGISGIAGGPTTQTVTTTLDALLQKTFTEAASLDALVQGTATEATSLDALIQGTATTTVGLDALAVYPVTRPSKLITGKRRATTGLIGIRDRDPLA